MSAVGTNGVRVLRPFNGFTRPGLPAGSWVGVGSVVGDATGGVRRVRIPFNEAGVALDSRFYSIEQCSVFDARVTNSFVLILNQGFDDTPIGAILNAFTMRLRAAAVQSAANTRDGLPQLFIGQQASTGAPSEILADFPNVDVTTAIFSCQGYFWTPRSILAPDGGLKRPQEGLYAI